MPENFSQGATTAPFLLSRSCGTFCRTPCCEGVLDTYVVGVGASQQVFQFVAPAKGAVVFAPRSAAVLSLIKDEGAAATIHNGDFDYARQPDGVGEPDQQHPRRELSLFRDHRQPRRCGVERQQRVRELHPGPPRARAVHELHATAYFKDVDGRLADEFTIQVQ